MRMSLTLPIAAALTVAAIFNAPTQTQATEPHHSVVSGDTVKWGKAPPTLPPGAEAAVLHGHPGKPGPFVLRLKFPAGYIVPPHRHSKDELVTVISGQFVVTAGEKVNRAATPLPPGSFIHLPAGMAHFAMASSATVVQINGVGPFDVTYIDPKDDPRNR